MMTLLRWNISSYVDSVYLVLNVYIIHFKGHYIFLLSGRESFFAMYRYSRLTAIKNQ